MTNDPFHAAPVDGPPPPPPSAAPPPPTTASRRVETQDDAASIGLIIAAVGVCALVAASALLTGLSDDEAMSFAMGRATGSLVIPGIAFAFFRSRKGKKSGWVALLAAGIFILIVNAVQNLPAA